MKEAEAETRYARSGGLHIAYQVLGDGPRDLIYVPGVVSHLEYQWEEESQARFFRKLASFCRLIRFDKRGSGLSDPLDHAPTLEERMDDVRAVLDAVGSRRTALLGLSEGGPLALLFAATYPDRASSLILWNTFASLVRREPDHPIGYPPASIDQVLDVMESAWGTGALIEAFAADSATDPSFRAWWARFERMSLSPGAARRAMRMNLEIDIRGILHLVRVPTLVLQTADDAGTPAACGKYLAERISGATYFESPGRDHFAWRDPNVPAEVERFLTGGQRPVEVDRILTTVLFADIVGSTERAAAVGDRSWREALDRYLGIAKRHIEYFRGRFIDAAGDGILAIFDGPGRAIGCARAIGQEARSIDLTIRSGLHTGEVEVTGERIAGLAVHIGARVSALAQPDEVLVTSTVKDLVVGSGLVFQDRGAQSLKGVPGEWRVFALAG
jgi:pimeloyl-ACP methyl ester carboxylesterase